jgi:nitroreductase
MELDACIRGRRSVRAYEDKPVPKELVEEVIEAGTWAPTGMGREPWRFVVIEDKERIKFVSDETKKAVIERMPAMRQSFSTDRDVICYDAPALIFICTPEDKQWSEVRLCDSVLAAENMFLKAFELGLGSCYMGFINFLSDEVLKKAGVPEGYELQVPLILGYPKMKQGAGKRKKADVAWIK